MHQCVGIWGILLFICAASAENLSATQLDQLFKFSAEEQQQQSRGSLNFSKCGYERGDFRRIVLSATSAMDFFDRHVDGLVLDATIGTRIMESQLMLIRTSHPKLPQAVQMYLMTLQFKSELLSEEILDKFNTILSTNELTENERQSLSRQLAWVQNASLWETPQVSGWKPIEALRTELLQKPLDRTQEIMDEDTSDRCISSLFDSCIVTAECAKLFTTAPHSMYSLTHQVIFFLIARKKGCFPQIPFRSKIPIGDAEEFLRMLCQRVWNEANEIERNGFPPEFRDILAEQVTVCSLAGYPNFLKRSWLEKILSWQNPDDDLGCFIDYLGDSKINATDAATTDPSRNNSKVTKSSFDEGTLRKKRSDETLRFGQTKCSIHFTAVSLSALAMHLRYFADTCLRGH